MTDFVLCKSAGYLLAEHNLNRRRSKAFIWPKKRVMYNKLHFYAFLCRYNYVLLVSCWIGFSLVFRVCCLFSVLCFRMLTLPYLVSIPQFHFKAIQHKGGISYSFSGVVVVIHGTSRCLATHTSIAGRTKRAIFRTDLKNFYIILASPRLFTESI